MDGDFKTHESVQDYYGRILQSSADLKTSACCLAEAGPARVLEALKNVHEDVKSRFYGCGSPIPPALEGLKVLDLGCGSGRDCYVLAQLVGAEGQVTGLDMTTEQLELARSTQAWHAERFGYANTRFVQGYIEQLDGIDDASLDLVVSNCVINLSPDKERVFREIFRVLKPGGELYFSDVFSDRRIPATLATDAVMLGECLGGALYEEDFRRLMLRVGCADVRIVTSSPLLINNPELEQRAGNIRFYSRTVRAFKLDLEDRCEDYGQVAIYLGTLPEAPHAFTLDDHHHFVSGKPMLVCGNTADMLGGSRYAAHFRVFGEKTQHFGLFDCAPPGAVSAVQPGACC
ncbi:methyltransferase domain-containing protein [Algiphilus sp. W345]|uniref:Arsenite methyltransferase n=1 Tax=Banduia mediterranea TaxID=3075609 RepID=A0ABU2WFJ2_9GAMM|nr:methyltransferase domain-containing protein [Algiphilus sp. W345]MDT0496640.1 methyltransferase domain-containing protein [Algiphilus sp. W345]